MVVCATISLYTKLNVQYDTKNINHIAAAATATAYADNSDKIIVIILLRI